MQTDVAISCSEWSYYHGRTLENKSNLLEIEASDFRECLSAASNGSKILQEWTQEMRTSNKEKDNTIIWLICRQQTLEEVFEKVHIFSDDKEARLIGKQNVSRYFREVWVLWKRAQKSEGH